MAASKMLFQPAPCDPESQPGRVSPGEVGGVTATSDEHRKGDHVSSAKLRRKRQRWIDKLELVGVLQFFVDTRHHAMRNNPQQRVRVVWCNSERAAIEHQAAPFIVAFMLVCKESGLITVEVVERVEKVVLSRNVNRVTAFQALRLSRQPSGGGGVAPFVSCASIIFNKKSRSVANGKGTGCPTAGWTSEDAISTAPRSPSGG